MPTTNPTNQATSSVLTTICGTGPLMVLDLAAVPVAAMLPIVKAALRVAEEWDAANIGTPEYEGAEEALTSLSDAANALDELFTPIIPGGPHVNRVDLMCIDTYPIIRNGQVEQVKVEDLTSLEMEAVHRWLSFHASVTAHNAEALRLRQQEITSASA